MDGYCATDGEIGRDGLGFPEQFVLWTMRIWVLGLHQERSVVPVIDQAFSALRTDNGGRLVERMMVALAEGARRTIDIRPPCYPTLSADEQRLLDLVRYLQQDDPMRPLFVLSSFLRPECRGAVRAIGYELARLLLSAGVDLTGSGIGPAALEPQRRQHCSH